MYRLVNVTDVNIDDIIDDITNNQENYVDIDVNPEEPVYLVTDDVDTIKWAIESYSIAGLGLINMNLDHMEELEEEDWLSLNNVSEVCIYNCVKSKEDIILYFGDLLSIISIGNGRSTRDGEVGDNYIYMGCYIMVNDPSLITHLRYVPYLNDDNIDAELGSYQASIELGKLPSLQHLSIPYTSAKFIEDASDGLTVLELSSGTSYIQGLRDEKSSIINAVNRRLRKFMNLRFLSYTIVGIIDGIEAVMNMQYLEQLDVNMRGNVSNSYIISDFNFLPSLVDLTLNEYTNNLLQSFSESITGDYNLILLDNRSIDVQPDTLEDEINLSNVLSLRYDANYERIPDYVFTASFPTIYNSRLEDIAALNNIPIDCKFINVRYQGSNVAELFDDIEDDEELDRDDIDRLILNLMGNSLDRRQYTNIPQRPSSVIRVPTRDGTPVSRMENLDEITARNTLINRGRNLRIEENDARSLDNRNLGRSSSIFDDMNVRSLNTRRDNNDVVNNTMRLLRPSTDDDKKALR